MYEIRERGDGRDTEQSQKRAGQESLWRKKKLDRPGLLHLDKVGRGGGRLAPGRTPGNEPDRVENVERDHGDELQEVEREGSCQTRTGGRGKRVEKETHDHGSVEDVKEGLVLNDRA